MNDPSISDLISRTTAALLSFEDPALAFFARRDLLEEDPGDPSSLWELIEVRKVLEKQHPDGYWPYPSRAKGAHPTENYHILQTYRTLGILIDMYGMDRAHPALARAGDYLFLQQSEQGDFRGIFGSQYAPHYSAGILELLIRAGFEDRPGVERCFGWFENTRQEEGGWAWPLRTTNTSYQDAIEMAEPVRSDYSKPFSHALTGFVIRAYAAHPVYRKSTTAREAGDLLKSRFFKQDRYADRRGAEYWLKFQYPFWWGNLLTGLDSLSWMDYSPQDPEIRSGLAWFLGNQQENGFWPTGYGKGTGADPNQAWVALAVGRMLQRFLNSPVE